MPRSRWTVLAGVASLAVAVGPAGADDWKPPEAAVSREAFEAQYPKQTASAAALEIVALGAKLGIDARPDGRADDGPDAEKAAGSERTREAAREYVLHELEEANDAVSAPPPVVARFMEENDATLAALVGAASGRREVVWDLDVRRGTKAPVPNWGGLTGLQRLLACRALIDLRRGDQTSALEAVEGIWRIALSLANRPELLSQTVATAQARLAVGLLRKTQSPAYGWETRLREGQFFERFLAAFQNDPWPAADDPALTEEVETLVRIYRRFADGLIERSGCDWTRSDLQHSWNVAVSGESDAEQMIVMQYPASIIHMVIQAYRFLLDSELTALVLDARAERAASRQDEWPARFPNLESSVCRGRFFKYRRAGGITLSFEGSAPASDSGGLALPLAFKGAPPPTRTPTPVPPTLTPTATPNSLGAP